MNNLEEGTGTFLSKLKHQMRPAEPEAVQVAAELLYVHSLVVSTDGTKSKTKAQLIDGVLSIHPGETTPLPDDLRDALRAGVARPGQAYNNYRWKMFRYLIWFYQAVKRLESGERRRALKSLDGFRAMVRPLDEQTVWSQRFALEHLLFPDTCPAVLSRDDRQAIVSALGDPGESLEELVARLEPNIGYEDRRGVNLYRTPYRQKWQPPNPKIEIYLEWAVRVQQTVDLDDRERNYKLETAVRLREALVAAQRGEDAVPLLKRGLQGANLVDYRVTDDFLHWAGEHPSEIRQALSELATRPGPASIDRFPPLCAKTSAACWHGRPP